MGPRRYEMIDEGFSYDANDPYQDSAVKKRYDMKRCSLQERQDTMRGKKIWVYTNGKLKDGHMIVFSRKKFRTLEALFLEIVAQKNKPGAGTGKVRVDHLHRWPSGEEVRELSEIEAEGQIVFVCKEQGRLVTDVSYHGMDYEGTDPRYSRSEKPSPCSDRSQLSSHRSMKSQPIKIMVISNTHRNSQQSVMVNPGREFEYILADITDMLDMANPPCKALHPIKFPREKADSNSSFRRIVNNRRVDTFYAVGEEGKVLPQSPRNLSPMRNGYSSHQQKSKNGMRQNGSQSHRTVNGYDRHEGRDDYEDNEGRPYRRHQDDGYRQRPDGYDEKDMYTPRSDRYDRQRRESPGRQQQKQMYQRRTDDREEWRRDERHDTNRKGNNDRAKYDDYNRRDDYDDRGRNGYDERDNKGRDQRDRFDKRRDDSPDRDRDLERGRRDDSRDRRGRNDRNREDSRNRNEKKIEDKRRTNKRQSESKSYQQQQQQPKTTRGRDDSEDRSNRKKIDSKRDTGKRDDDDDDRDQTRSNSPTESEMNDRINDMEGGKATLDRSIDF